MRRTSNFLVIGIGAVFLLLIIGFLLFQFNRSVTLNMENTATDAYTELVIQQQQAFNIEFERGRDGLESIAKAIIAFGYNEEEVAEYFSTAKDNFNYESLIIVDVNGKGIFNNEIVDISQHPYFEAALEGETTTSEPYMSDFTNNRVIAVAVPIYFEGYVQGIIVAEYNTGHLSMLLSSVVSEQGQALIVNCDGDILLSTGDELEDEFPYQNSVFSYEVTSDSVLEDFRNSEDNLVTYILGEEEFFAIYRPLNINLWNVVYIMPESVVGENVDEVFVLILVVSAVIIVAFLLLSIYIIISKQRSIKRVEKAAYYDELTGLRNLAKFKIDVEKILRNNRKKRYYMVKGDIVNFKAVNELYDFNVGNEVLKTIALVGNEMNVCNFIQARMNSDEFIMFAESEFFEDMQKTSELYENRFRELLTCADGHQFSFRLGRYLIKPDDFDINSMVNDTNLAHSYAKTMGGKLVWDYDEAFKEHILKTTEITNRMKGALNREEFRVYLQPKYRVYDKKIISAEALVRWIDDNGNITFPNDFIPLFERNGFIIELDRYMLEKVCSLLSSWLSSDKPCIPISINLSRNNLANPNLANEIKAVADRYDVPHELIEIELTETGFADSDNRVKELLKQLKDDGFLVSIDDFGSGHSSLGLLKEFSADTLKLDRTFFVDHTDDIRGNLVVDGVVKIADSLDMFTVAEGIEDEAQHNFLKQIDCNAAQGYFYARPMPIYEFEDLIKDIDKNEE